MAGMNYFVAKGESLSLDEDARKGLRGSFASLSDGITHYELSGPADGEVVLLVPGLTIPLFYWDALANHLHKIGYRTLAYSAYGRGYSDRVVTTYDVGLFLRQARELIQYVGLKQVDHVMGTSMGALITMSMLQEPWIKPKSLTLVGPAGLESKLPLVARLAKWRGVAEFFGRHFGKKGVISHLDHNALSPMDVEIIKKMVLDSFQYRGSVYSLFSTLKAFPLVNQQDLYRKTQGLGIPTLLLWGVEDLVTPISRMGEVTRLLTPVESRVIPACGHMAPLERPETVASHFANFQRRRQGSSPADRSPKADAAN